VAPADIQADYTNWLKASLNNKKIKLPVARAQVEEIIATRTVSNVH